MKSDWPDFCNWIGLHWKMPTVSAPSCYITVGMLSWLGTVLPIGNMALSVMTMDIHFFFITPSLSLVLHPPFPIHMSPYYPYYLVCLTVIHSWTWRLWHDFILFYCLSSSAIRDSCCVPDSTCFIVYPALLSMTHAVNLCTIWVGLVVVILPSPVFVYFLTQSQNPLSLPLNTVSCSSQGPSEPRVNFIDYLAPTENPLAHVVHPSPVKDLTLRVLVLGSK